MRAAALALLALSGGGGCWMFTSKYEGEQLRKDVAQLQTKVDAMEKRDVDLSAATKEANEQVSKLKQILEEATKLVTRNSADFGLQVQRLQQDLAALTGRVDEIGHNLDAALKENQAWRAQADVKLESLSPGKTTGTTTTTATPPDKESLFTQARDKLAAGDHEEARRLLRQFLTQYPQDPRAAQAQLLHGESYFQQKKYAAAIGEFQKVIDSYPRSPSVEEALYKIGTSFLELRYCTDARTFLGEAIKRYPRTRFAPAIHKALADIQKNAKNRKLCTN
jgi:tol-pal system protein YbgF